MVLNLASSFSEILPLNLRRIPRAKQTNGLATELSSAHLTAAEQEIRCIFRHVKKARYPLCSFFSPSSILERHIEFSDVFAGFSCKLLDPQILHLHIHALTSTNTEATWRHLRAGSKQTEQVLPAALTAAPSTKTQRTKVPQARAAQFGESLALMGHLPSMPSSRCPLKLS